MAEYIKYRCKAKGSNKLPSYFVDKLSTECFPITIDKETFDGLTYLRKRLEDNSETIEVNDFGAGSKKLSNTRKISSIYAISSSKGKYGALLYRLANYYKPIKTLEFGTSLGIGTYHLHRGYPSSEITTIEACENTLEKAQDNFRLVKAENIRCIRSTFDDYLKSSPDTIFDMVFVDGHHDGDALINYLEQLKSITHDETIFIIDDIRWSNSMLRAWNILLNDPYYSVSIDLFRMGILSPQKNKPHEHATLYLRK